MSRVIRITEKSVTMLIDWQIVDVPVGCMVTSNEKIIKQKVGK